MKLHDTTAYLPIVPVLEIFYPRKGITQSQARTKVNDALRGHPGEFTKQLNRVNVKVRETPSHYIFCFEVYVGASNMFADPSWLTSELGHINRKMKPMVTRLKHAKVPLRAFIRPTFRLTRRLPHERVSLPEWVMPMLMELAVKRKIRIEWQEPFASKLKAARDTEKETAGA